MRTAARLGLLGCINVLTAAVAVQEFQSGAPVSPGLWWLMVGAVVVGTLGQALFAGLEIGLYCVNRVRLRVRSARREGVDSAARVLAGEVANMPRVLPSLLIGYNVLSAVGSYGLTNLLSWEGLTKWPLLLVNLVVVTPVMFVLGDMLPKELFRAGADRLMYSLAPLVRGWRLLLTYTGVLPVVQWLSHGLARLLVRRSSAENVESEIEQTRSHIHALLKEGAGEGVMSEAQLTLVDRAFGLRETEVGDEMIPWSRCKVVQLGWDRERVRSFIRQHPFSRFPVAEGGRLVGVIEFTSICLEPDRSLDDLVRPAVRMAAGVPVRDAMRTLSGAGERMAVVMEGGRPVGLVTMKDLVEPLTGELAVW